MGAKEPNLKDNTPRNSRQLWTWVCNPLGSGLFRNCRWWYQTRTRKSISTPLDLFLKLSHQMICRCAVGGRSACEKYRFTTSRISHDNLFIYCKLFGATSPCHIHFPSRWMIELVTTMSRSNSITGNKEAMRDTSSYVDYNFILWRRKGQYWLRRPEKPSARALNLMPNTILVISPSIHFPSR